MFKRKNILPFCLYLLIFLSLMVIASIFDFEISKILTSSSLNVGKYYSSSLIGSIIEIIGSFPIFIALLFACLIQGKNFYKRKDKSKYIALIFVIASIIDLTWFIKDTFKYAANIYGFKNIYELDFMMLIYIGLATILSLLAHFLYSKVSLKRNDELKIFSYVIFASCSFHILIELIKGPIGRMRYRGMNAINDFSYFTPWYAISSAKELITSSIIPSDAFKSFPSGHTHAAGISYLLICLPDIFEKLNNKKCRILCYIIPIFYTGLVAFYRIEVGAHFMSDVVVGGTLAFTTVSIFRYVFILRKKN